MKKIPPGRWSSALLGGVSALALGVACSGGSSGTGYVTGNVMTDPGDAPVAAAAIAIGASNAASGTDGSFSMNVTPGKHALDVVKAGFHEVHSDVVVARGQNTIHLRLVPCAPVDPACPTPTPTGSVTPTPIVTPANTNVVAAFDGINPILGSPYPAWTGKADIMGVTNRPLGDNVPAQSDAVTECWKAGNVATSAGDLRTDIDYCVVMFYGYDEAVVNAPADPDALFRIVVLDGALWQDGALLSLQAGSVEADYFEGFFNPANFQAEFTVSYQRPATEGVFRLGLAGFYNPQPVTLTSAAFLVPNLP